jgi:hypothetical protein
MGCIRHLLHNLECPSGRYPITLSFLDLLSTILSFLQRWKRTASLSRSASGSVTPAMMDVVDDPSLYRGSKRPLGFASTPGARSNLGVEGTPVPSSAYTSSAFDFHPCLSYIRTDLFSAYDTWRYKHIYERWQIGIKILKIFDKVLQDVTLPPVATLNVTSGASTPLSRRESEGFPTPSISTPSRGTPFPTPMAIATPAVGMTPKSAMMAPQQTTPRSVAEMPALAGNKRMKGTSLKESLLHSILYDSSFHKVLLNIVGIGTRFLEKLINQRKLKEAKTLHKLLVKAFLVLERVLESRETLTGFLGIGFDAAGGQTGKRSDAFIQQQTTTSLEYSLLNRMATGPMFVEDVAEEVAAPAVGGRGRGESREEAHLIGVIASYVHYPHKPSQLPLLATRLLTLLCGVTLTSGPAALGGPRAPSLVGYLGSRANAIRNAYISKLNDSLESEVPCSLFGALSVIYSVIFPDEATNSLIA